MAVATRRNEIEPLTKRPLADHDGSRARERHCSLHCGVVPARGAAARRYRACADGELIATFAAHLDAPARARQAVAAVLRARGYADALIEDATLVVSELGANAIRHAGSRFSVALAIADSSVRVAVSDARRGTAQELGMSAERLHGLGLVDAVSERWGVEPSARGKAVWAELPLPSASQPPSGAHPR